MRIPKSFKLFATPIEVVFDNNRMQDMECYGLAEYSFSKITLADAHELKPLSEGKIMDTFYHEKVHMILDTMGERDLSENEKFVDTFAKLLRQSDETAEYETGI